MLADKSTFSGYSVDDVDAAKRFYGETLGLSASEQGPGIVLELAGGNRVLVYGKGDAHEPASFTVLNFEVDEIEPAVDELTAAGSTSSATRAPTSRPTRRGSSAAAAH